MIEQADEIPVTYLNKGQTYLISIVDTVPPILRPTPIRFRTFICISFQDEQQRRRPATYWQLWKDNRGTKEAHQRGSELRAIEYVKAAQPAENDSKKIKIDFDTASFDGFSVLWTPESGGSADCHIAVQFNFLSTDFTRSKGVKGVLSRLCAKTEVVSTGSPHSTSEVSEICFCEVQLFRDHGAERKLLMDVAHIKKTISKLKQQIAQVDTGTKEYGKVDQRSSITTNTASSSRPGKVPKHKRTWSISSVSPAKGRVTTEEELHFKLHTMQDMSTSTRSFSALYLRGQEQDDHDLHPVQLPSKPLDLTKVETKESAAWQQRTNRRSSIIGETSSLKPPTSSSASLQPQGSARSGHESSTGAPPPTRGQWNEFPPTPPIGTELHPSNPQHLATPPDQPVKVQIQMPQQGSRDIRTEWIEVLGVDPSYRSPPERPVKPGIFNIFIHSGNFC
jgi:hypothetical protein